MANETPVVYCDVEQPSALGAGLSRWDGNAISWRDMGINYPNADFGEAMQYTRTLIMANCGLRIKFRTNQGANLQSYFKRIDGRQGVLARQYLPGTPSPLTQMQPGEWDSSEASWLSQDYLNVITCHEIMHGVGLNHHKGSSSLMNPQINMEWLGKLDAWTIDELQMRYGPPTIGEPDLGPGGSETSWQSFTVKMAQYAIEILTPKAS